MQKKQARAEAEAESSEQRARAVAAQAQQPQCARAKRQAVEAGIAAAPRSDACMSRPVGAGMNAGAGSFASPFSTRIISASSFMSRSCSKRNAIVTPRQSTFAPALARLAPKKIQIRIILYYFV
eukprot:scaffold24723_cov131-Isochrysis_galbana.AAC.4